MSLMLWSVLLSSIGILGTILIACKSKWGWLVYIIGELLWATYGIATEQWGFIASASVYLVLNVFALRRWHRQEHAAAVQA